MNPIPIVLLNGSLGSGKTTLVKRLLNSPEFAGSFLIENEFASVNIDRQAVAEDHDHEIYEISGSCICCSSGEELEEALNIVVAKGWDKPVILEATGMANSAVLLRRLFLNQSFTRHFRVLSSVLMIDAAETAAEELSQELTLEIKLSDIVVINKTDLAPNAARQLGQTAQQLNQHATVISATRAEFDPAFIARATSNTEVSFAQLFSELSDIEPTTSNYAVVDVEHPLDPEKVLAAFDPDTASPNMRLRRAKGFFVDHAGTQWHLEATAKHIELHEIQKPKQHVIVAIGDGISKTMLRDVIS